MKRKARCLPGCSQNNTETILRCRFPLILQHLTKTSMTKPYLHTSSLLHKHHLHTSKQIIFVYLACFVFQSVLTLTFPKVVLGHRLRIQSPRQLFALQSLGTHSGLFHLCFMIAKLWISAPVTFSEFHQCPRAFPRIVCGQH